MHVVVGVVALSQVVSVGVGEEGFGAQFLDSAYDVVHEEGLHIVGVAQFAHMQFDGYKVALFDAAKGACGVVEAVCFHGEITVSIPW